MQTPFTKMNGSGNDFVIFDARHDSIRLSPEQVRSIAARDNATTKGCDQVIVLEHSQKADVFMRIFNADGGQIDACGNATRCVAGILEAELHRLPVSIETNVAVLQGLQKAYSPEEEEYILVDMGAPSFEASRIPLAGSAEEVAKKIEALTGLTDPSFVNMGNPHVVFFLRFSPGGNSQRDVEPLFEIALESIGPKLEKARDIFPEGVNASIALLREASDGLGHIMNARVWERGAGLTQACGTAACAMLAAAHARDESITQAHIWFEPFGTSVTVKRDEQGHMLLGGPIATEHRGVVAL